MVVTRSAAPTSVAAATSPGPTKVHFTFVWLDELVSGMPPVGWAELDSLVWLMAPSRLIVFLITGKRALPTIGKMGNSIPQVKIYATVLPAA